MKKAPRLSQWQIVLIVIGSLLILAPMAWDMLTATFTSLADVELEEVFTRGGMFVVGALLLAIVGVYEIFKDFNDKPKSKHIK